MARSLQSFRLTAVLLACMVLGGCSDTNGDETNGDPPSSESERTIVPESTATSEPREPTLVGHWVRQPGEPCAQVYPLELDFRDQVYTVVNDPGQPLGPLDGGDLEIVDGETIRLMTPIDAMATYRYRVSERELSLIDESGCEVTYERSDSGSS